MVGTSHVIICKISEQLLNKNQIRKLEYLLTGTIEQKKSFYELCSWQDDLKTTSGLYIMKNWHFTDIPYKMPPYNDSELNIPLPTYNITSYLYSSYQTLNDKTTKSLWAWSFHLRSILHFIGDIHTPHHNIQMFSNKYPNGDGGGNSYKLKCNYSSACRNIHSFWDSCGLQYPLYNFTSSDIIEELNENISLLIKKYPYSKLKSKLKFNPNYWSQEANQIAQTYGYSTPENQEPSEEYFNLTISNSTYQIVLACYRLGKYLKKVINSAPIDESTTNVWIANAAIFVVDCILLYIAFRPLKKDMVLVTVEL